MKNDIYSNPGIYGVIRAHAESSSQTQTQMFTTKIRKRQILDPCSEESNSKQFLFMGTPLKVIDLICMHGPRTGTSHSVNVFDPPVLTHSLACIQVLSLTPNKTPGPLALASTIQFHLLL